MSAGEIFGRELLGVAPAATDVFGGALYALDEGGHPVTAAPTPPLERVRSLLLRTAELVESRGYLSAKGLGVMVDAFSGPLTLEQALLAADGDMTLFRGAEQRMAGFREEEYGEDEQYADVESWDCSYGSTTQTTAAMLRGAAAWPGWDDDETGGVS